MTDFEKNLSNLPVDASDPKLLFYNLLDEHKGLVSTLKALSIKNNRLVGELRDTEYIEEVDFRSMANQLSYLEVQSLVQPNLDQIPAVIEKSSIVKALVNIGSGDYNIESDLTFLNIGDDWETADDLVDLKTFNIGMDEKFLSLLPPSFASIIMNIAFDSTTGTVNVPKDQVMGIIMNLLELKRKTLQNSLGTYWGDFVEPFLNYQTFLEENQISVLIERLHLIERFMLEAKIFSVPMTDLSYSGSLLWSRYFYHIFLYGSLNRIRFFNCVLPNLNSSNYSEQSVGLVKEYVDILQNQNYARQCQEIVSRCNRFINNVGNKVEPTTLEKQFVGLEVSQ